MHNQSSPPSFKSRGGIKRVFNAFKYSMKGLNAALKHEAAFRQECALALILLPAAFWLGRNAIEIFLLCFTVVLVLILELINSAIEALADAISTDQNPLLGRAKDIGSAAVFLALCLLTLWWLYVIADRFWLSANIV